MWAGGINTRNATNTYVWHKELKSRDDWNRCTISNSSKPHTLAQHLQELAL